MITKLVRGIMEKLIDNDTKKKLEDRLEEYSKYGTSLCYLLEEKRVRILMGDKVEPRKEWIEENVEFSLEDNYKIA